MSSRTHPVALAVIVAAVFGCGSEPLTPLSPTLATLDTFPFVEGTEWVYRLSDAPEAPPTTASAKLSSVYNGMGHPSDSWLVTIDKSDPSVFKGWTSRRDGAVSFNQVVLFPTVFKLQFPLVEGTSWDSGPGEATVMGRTSVVVPMGLFRDAVHVVAEGREIFDEASYTLEFWFVPNVGVVKAVWNLSRERSGPPHRIWELIEVRSP